MNLFRKVSVFNRHAWLRFMYSFTVLFILGYGCLFSYTYITDLVAFESRELHVFREKELLKFSRELDNEVKAGKTTVNNIKQYFSIYNGQPDAAHLAELQLNMSNALSLNPNQYNCYFALEPGYAQRLARKDAYIMTVKKNVAHLGQERYGQVQDRIVEFWYDPMYQTSEQEVWYHVAKKSCGFEVSPVYFDSSYMKVWMFTIGMGLCEKGVFQGMVGLDILADSYFQDVETSTLNNTGGLFVVDGASHKILTRIHPEKENLPLNVPDRNQTALPPALDALTHNPVTEVEYAGQDGDTYIMSAVQLENLPWILVSYQNKKKVYAGIYRKVVSIVFFSGLLMVSSVFVITFLMRRLGRIFQELDNAKIEAEQYAVVLKQTQQKLIEAERLAVLGEFAGSVAHEIRNPLGVISGSAYYLKRRIQSDDPAIRTRLDEIMRHVDRTSDIIESIVKLTRMAPPALQPAPLGRIIENSIRMAKLPQGVTVEQGLPQEDVFIQADAAQFQIALKNIFVNASQAMDGQGVLRIHVTQVAQNGASQVELRIEDMGQGIAPECMDKIFSPLFTTKTYGIGFGLSIVKMIVERHNGTVSAESEPGRGAAFVIRLPQGAGKAQELSNG